MSRMSNLIEEAGDPWKYVKDGEELDEIPKYVLDDIRVPVRIDMKLPDSGNLKEAPEERQAYKNSSGQECIRVDEAFWTHRANWAKERKYKRTIPTGYSEETPEETNAIVIVSETDCEERPKPQEGKPLTESDAQKTNRIREEGMRYRIPIWKGEQSRNHTTPNADEEVRKLADYAETDQRNS